MNTSPSFPSLSLLSLSLAVSGNSENLPRDKTKPGPALRRFYPLLYTRSRRAVPPLRLDQTVYPAELSASPSLQYVRAAPNSPSVPFPHPTLPVPDHHLEQTPPGIHDQTPGAPSFLNILFTRRPLLPLCLLEFRCTTFRSVSSSRAFLSFSVTAPPEHRCCSYT